MKKEVQLFVRDILPGGGCKTLRLDPDDTVYGLMAQIEDLTGFPPILQRIDYNCNHFYHDTPGTLADNKLANPSSDHTNTVSMYFDCSWGWHMLRKKTLRNLGFNVYGDEDVDDPSYVLELAYPDQKKMFITVTDDIRMDGGERKMVMVVVAEDTVAAIMERVQRRRRYPVAMQRFSVRNPGECGYRQMDKLDATLADYDVREDSRINLYMDSEFAFQADRERRKKVNKAKEIAADDDDK